MTFKHLILGASVVLVVSTLGASQASAGLLGDGAGSSGSPPTTSAPSLPSLPLPGGSAAGTVAQVVDDVVTGVTRTTATPPPPLPPPSPAQSSGSVAQGLGSPPVAGGSPTAGAVDAEAGSEPGGSGQGTEAGPRAAATATNEAGRGESGPGGRAVEPAEAAKPPRGYAAIWPAIALGPMAERLAVLVAGLERAASLSAFDLARLSAPLIGVLGLARQGVTAERSGTSEGPRAPSVITAPVSGRIDLVLMAMISLLALIGVVSLARLVVGEEFFSSLRWPH